MPTQTSDRILETSLAMFNVHGEPNVTANHIADELEISTGNLYYHFRNKDNIVEQLFLRFETRMDQALVVPADRLPNLEDIWVQLQFVFQCMWDFRFIYRDLVDILSRNRKLKTHFGRILNHASQSAIKVLQGLTQAEIMRATNLEIRAIVENILLVATFWLNFNAVRNARPNPNEEDITQGIYQVMLLIAPFLRDVERAQLNALAETYKH